MLYGMTMSEFWESNPRIVAIYADAFTEKQKHADEQMWAMGRYAFFAVYTAVGKLFSSPDKPFDVDYPDRPLTWPQRTQEEIEAEEADRELRKALAAEEAWIRVEKRMGLPDSL